MYIASLILLLRRRNILCLYITIKSNMKIKLLLTFILGSIFSYAQVKDSINGVLAKDVLIIRDPSAVGKTEPPLYVLDGKVITEDDFKNIAPNTIKDIHILKDKGATALYGHRAINGAVIIETKKPQKGSRFSIGGLPAVSYDSDLGLKYGVAVFAYDYGDRSDYPNFDQSLYLEWSDTTKGSMIAQIVYDTKTLILGVRLKSEVGYFTEQAIDFYGFNGSQVLYNSNFEDNKHSDYISRMFYRQRRQLLRIKADILGKTKVQGLSWLAGLSNYSTKIKPVDIAHLNEGKEEDLLPEVKSLYESYLDWGIINPSETKGNSLFLKGGLVYDSRDNEANPNSGIWSEVLLFYAPKFFANENKGYTRMALTHRQYFAFIPDRFTFAYRLSWQFKLGGEMPFYMLPYIYDSQLTNDGLGGSKSLRGILRNREVGNGIAFCNFELRYRLFKTTIFKQELYTTLSTFVDGGIVTQPYKINTEGVKDAYGYTAKEIKENWFNTDADVLHATAGIGLHFAINGNMIIALDYGRAFRKEDGNSGFYMGFNFLF